jgi:hypothetical protein
MPRRRATRWLKWVVPGRGGGSMVDPPGDEPDEGSHRRMLGDAESAADSM